MRADDSELRALQARAYGRDADIHLDPAALRRLRELEGETGRTPGEATDAVGTAPAPAPGPQASVSAPAPQASAAPRAPHAAAPALAAEDQAEPTMRARAAWFLRRPAILAGLAVLLAAAGVATGLAIGHRDPPDPLQRHAVEVARLPVDHSYVVPRAFGGGTAFREYDGLRAIVQPGGQLSGNAEGGACLNVYLARDVTDPEANEFSGELWNGCAAGAFPAAVQFQATSGMPDALQADFPHAGAVQLVYDKADDEVIVFADHR
jgi:hypothetical protein